MLILKFRGNKATNTYTPFLTLFFKVAGKKDVPK